VNTAELDDGTIHVNTGIRISDMPLVRMLRAVTIS
jgi:hypothetical protein